MQNDFFIEGGNYSHPHVSSQQWPLPGLRRVSVKERTVEASNVLIASCFGDLITSASIIAAKSSKNIATDVDGSAGKECKIPPYIFYSACLQNLCNVIYMRSVQGLRQKCLLKIRSLKNSSYFSTSFLWFRLLLPWYIFLIWQRLNHWYILLIMNYYIKIF